MTTLYLYCILYWSLLMEFGSIETGEGKTIVSMSKGKNSANETVAEFLITWSFKAKTS